MNFSQDTVQGLACPVLAVCGFSGSGKTTLLESAVPRLVQRGLAVAVVKHDAHGFVVDRPGKDSDRLFRAGATISLRGSHEQFERRASPLSLEVTLARLACDHDLLLVEGHKDTPRPKLWLSSPNGVQPPEEVTGIISTLPWSGNPTSTERLSAFLEYIDHWLPVAWNARPLYRGLLMGGRSARMGQPKQALRFGGRELAEIAAEALLASSSEPPTACEHGLVVLGAGTVPSNLAAVPQLPDARGFAGPGAGMIAAHRWAPEAAWIVAACDHPWLRPAHIEWLAAQRKPGRWAVIPVQSDGHPCLTMALYEPQALEAMERLARTHPGHSAHPSLLLDLPRTSVLHPPPELADGWTNVNTPEQLRTEERKLR